jgi:hypothetical protein
MGTLVKAELRDGTVCQLAHEALVRLLVRNEIARFQRSDGWAVIGRDPLRNKEKGPVYSIPERRIN